MKYKYLKARRPLYSVTKNTPTTDTSSYHYQCNTHANSPAHYYKSLLQRKRRSFLNVSPKKCKSNECLVNVTDTSQSSSIHHEELVTGNVLNGDVGGKKQKFLPTEFGISSSDAKSSSVKKTELHFIGTKAKQQTKSCNDMDAIANDSTFVMSVSKNSQHKLQNDKKLTNDEDVIILSDEDEKISFASLDIKQCVRNIVDNVLMDETSSIDDLDAAKIAQRMQVLYHHDFVDRLDEIERHLNNAKKRCTTNANQLKEVLPGIRQLDLDTLGPGQWLNDVIINKYISLLVDSKPWACCVSSFFYNMLQRKRTPSLPEEWHEKKYFFIPVCIGHHWSLLCVEPDEQHISIYNSMATTDNERDCAITIKNYLQMRYDNELKKSTEWKVIVPANVARQQNEYDCGVYVCMFSRLILFDLSSDIDPSNVTAFRGWIRTELEKNHLRS